VQVMVKEQAAEQPSSTRDAPRVCVKIGRSDDGCRVWVHGQRTVCRVGRFGHLGCCTSTGRRCLAYPIEPWWDAVECLWGGNHRASV
jgi:hypothetical protein